MQRIDLLGGAVRDLTELRRSDPSAAAEVIVVLQELNGCPDPTGLLTSHGNVTLGKHRLNIKGWVSARKNGANLSRLRILDSSATSYRVIYGYDWIARRIGVLAVRHKHEISYNLSDELERRIVADWYAATGGTST
jgi:hypothetical protein